MKLSFTYENSSSRRFKYNAAHRLRYLFPLAMIILGYVFKSTIVSLVKGANIKLLYVSAAFALIKKLEFISAQPDVQAITMRKHALLQVSWSFWGWSHSNFYLSCTNLVKHVKISGYLNYISCSYSAMTPFCLYWIPKGLSSSLNFIYTLPTLRPYIH